MSLTFLLFTTLTTWELSDHNSSWNGNWGSELSQWIPWLRQEYTTPSLASVERCCQHSGMGWSDQQTIPKGPMKAAWRSTSKGLDHDFISWLVTAFEAVPYPTWILFTVNDRSKALGLFINVFMLQNIQPLYIKYTVESGITSLSIIWSMTKVRIV